MISKGQHITELGNRQRFVGPDAKADLMNVPISSFSLTTLGCKVNQYDTQSLREHLLGLGIVEIPFDSGADLAIVNTCAVTEEAVRKSRKLVRRARRLNPGAAVAVTGCHASESADELRAEPGVAWVAGATDEFALGLTRLLDGSRAIPEGPPRPNDAPRAAIAIRTGGAPPTAPDRQSALVGSEEPGTRLGGSLALAEDAEDEGDEPTEAPAAFAELPLYGEVFTQTITRFDGHTRAFLKVQDGCDNFCSFCIIPFLRGHVRSKTVAAALAETQALLAAGHREIVLTGVHLGAFGRSGGARARRWAGPGAPAPDETGWTLNRTNRLADLVEALVALPGDWRLRLSSIEATEVTQRLLDVMAGSPRACPQFHLPLQSGCDRTLHRMNRRYSSSDYLRVVERIRDALPDCAITTDLIVGFPGETEDEFAQTLATARAAGFSKIHIFPFSARPGTAAYAHSDQVAAEVRKDRCRRLAELERELADAFHRPFVGSTARVLIEEPPDAATRTLAGSPARGLTERYGDVAFALPDGAAPGDLIAVRLAALVDGRFEGTSMNDESMR